MNYGIKKIIKKKLFSDGKVILAELFGNNLYGVLIFKHDELIDCLCNCCFENSNKKEIVKQIKKKYKQKINQYFYKNA